MSTKEPCQLWVLSNEEMETIIKNNQTQLILENDRDYIYYRTLKIIILWH